MHVHKEGVLIIKSLVHLVLMMGKPLKMYANVLKDFHSSEKSKIYVYQIF